MDRQFENATIESDNDDNVDDIDWVELLLDNFDGVDNLPNINLNQQSNTTNTYQYITDGYNLQSSSQNEEKDNQYTNYKPITERVYIRQSENTINYDNDNSKLPSSFRYIPSFSMISMHSCLNYPLKTKIISNYNLAMTQYKPTQMITNTLRNLTIYIESHPRIVQTKNAILDSSGYVKESFHYITDRTSSVTENYVKSTLTADDPDIQHMNRLANDTSWETLPLRCSLASLTWSQLQLVTNDYSQSNVNIYKHNTSNQNVITNTNTPNNNNNNNSNSNNELQLYQQGDANTIHGHRAYHRQHSSAMYKYLLTLKTSSHPLLTSNLPPSSSSSSSISNTNIFNNVNASMISNLSWWSFLSLPLQLHTALTSYYSTTNISTNNPDPTSTTITNINNITNDAQLYNETDDGNIDTKSDLDENEWIDEHSSHPHNNNMNNNNTSIIITTTSATTNNNNNNGIDTSSLVLTDQWWLASKAQQGCVN